MDHCLITASLFPYTCTCIYIYTHTLLCTHTPDFTQSSRLFASLHKSDPYMVTNMDIYSNVLFVLVRYIHDCGQWFNPLSPRINGLKKQKTLYKVLAPSANLHINSYELMGIFGHYKVYRVKLCLCTQKSQSSGFCVTALNLQSRGVKA